MIPTRTGCAHARAHRIALEGEEIGKRRQNGAFEDRREPNKGFLDYIFELEHRSADAHRNDVAPFVVLRRMDGKADHLGAAANEGRVAARGTDPMLMATQMATELPSGEERFRPERKR